jgi:hypothetical protein
MGGQPGLERLYRHDINPGDSALLGESGGQGGDAGASGTMDPESLRTPDQLIQVGTPVGEAREEFLGDQGSTFPE